MGERGKALLNEFKIAKALTGLDRESAHPLQLHAVKRSCCTAANPGGTGRLSAYGMTCSGLAAVQQIHFTA